MASYVMYENLPDGRTKVTTYNEDGSTRTEILPVAKRSAMPGTAKGGKTLAQSRGIDTGSYARGRYGTDA